MFVTPSTLDEAKRQLRGHARALRARTHDAAGPAAADALLRQFLRARPALAIDVGAVVAGYWPMGTEMDPRPLLHHLDSAGHPCLLPVVTGADEALTFRRWHPGRPPPPGFRGIPEPGPDAPELRPRVVLVPLLAFDRDGGRLGQGGGHYDRTLAALDGTDGPVLAVGLAYAAQQVEQVPRGPWDRRLDWIITEQGAFGTAS